MFCKTCGFPIEGEDVYCRRCGLSLAPEAAKKKRRLRRPEDGKKVAGVCAGVAEYFGKDPRLVRALWAGASILPFSPGLIAYGVCWAVMPRGQKRGAKQVKPAAARTVRDKAPIDSPK